MSRLTRWAAVALVSLFLASCSSKSEPVPKNAPPATKAPRLEGEIHAAGQRQRILPFVVHEPGLDLRVQCLRYRDMRAEEGKDVPLCFDETQRQVEATMRTLRIEHHEGMRIAEALHLLRSVDESAHFVVDDGGTPYQLLDMAHAPRREARYQAAELRVVSGHAEGHARLTKALQGLYPKLTVEMVQIERPKAKPDRAPTAPLPAAPVPPGNPQPAPSATP